MDIGLSFDAITQLVVSHNKDATDVLCNVSGSSIGDSRAKACASSCPALGVLEAHPTVCLD
jgi:hypothetical protein